MKEPAYAMNQSNFAEMYERGRVGLLFRPFVEVLLERAHHGSVSAGSAAMTERNNALTDSEDLKTAATSGSRTTAIVPLPICSTKRLGLAFL